MKRIISFFIVTLIILFTVVSAVGCQAEPLASFTADKVSGEAPLLVNFTNTSQNADEYRWDFGDGNTTTTYTLEESINHEYTKVGDYTVKLTAAVTGKTPELSSVMEVNISVKHGPLASFIITPRNVTLDINQVKEFNYECLDDYGNPIPEVQITWEVDDEAGTITDGILTTGTKAGRYKDAVSATAELDNVSLEESASISINPGPLDVVMIIPALVEIAAGESQQLEFVAEDEHGNLLYGLDPTWSMLNDSAGSITENGIITVSKKADNYDESILLEVKQGDLVRRDDCVVNVVPGPLEQIAVTPEEINTGIGMEQQFIAAVADEYGNRITSLDCKWIAADDVGIITSSGLFTAGTTPDIYKDAVTFEVTQGDITRSVSCDITVEPDRIIFISNQHNEDEFSYDIYIMDADGSNSKRLTNMDGEVNFNISASPDGRRIIFGIDQNIYTINIDGTWQMAMLVDRKACEPAWSPDGTKIVFQSWEHDPSEIYTMDIDGGNLVQLTDDSNYDDYPNWSPDSRKIAFVSERNGNADIYTMNADGSNQKRLTTDSHYDFFPAWSPDGTEILFQSNRSVGQQTWGVYIMNADGSNVRPLQASVSHNSNLPSWSPDGSKIVFNSNRDNNQVDIYIMDRDGSNVTRLTDSSALNFAPIWLPRVAGVEVNEASLVITDISIVREELTAQAVTAQSRGAIVRIETEHGSGSGFIIRDDGLLLTNNHVISDAQEITVYLDDGTEYEGAIEARDLVHDIALVRIDATKLPTLEFGNLREVSLGQQVMVLGYPLGKEKITVTSGLVSNIEYDIGRNITWIQTDSAVNMGNSGGPLLNLQGQVIGMIAAKFVGISVEGVGHAISVDTLNMCLVRLFEGESIMS